MCQKSKISIVQKLTSALTALTLTTLSLPVSAMDRPIQTITTISEVLIAPKGQRTLHVYDWDDTIPNHSSSTLREGIITKQHLEQVINNGHGFLVLTARGEGQSPSESYAVGDYPAIKMMECLNLNQQITIDVDKYKLLTKSDFKPLIDTDVAVLTENVVFAGSQKKTNSNKGQVLATLLDLKLFSGEPYQEIVFVDDKVSEVNDMKKVFESRSEKLTIYHFPKKK